MIALSAGFALIGEYVIEIVEVIASAISVVNARRFAEFALENPGFMATTRRRATSYWGCYHRGRFPNLRTYPAIAVLDPIEQAAGLSHVFEGALGCPSRSGTEQ